MPRRKSLKAPNVKPVLSLSRTDVSIKWSTDNIQRLLKLIRSKDKYRLAFFPQGSIKHKVCDVARELCIELQEDDPKCMEMLERRGQVIRKGRKWIPTKTWTSSYNNPVVTKYHEATVGYTVLPNWSSFKDVPVSFRKDFQKSYPWYFMFKALDDKPQSPSPEATSSPPQNATTTRTRSRPTSCTAVADAGQAEDSSDNLRPKSKKRGDDESTTLGSRPPSHAHRTGHSNQSPIVIGSESDSSACVEITSSPNKKPKESTQRANSPKLRIGSEADKIALKRLKRQLRAATREPSHDETTEPKIFKYIPTERHWYMEADPDGQECILTRARVNLLFRVLRDLEGFVLPRCLVDCGMFIDPLFDKNHSARVDQIRRIVRSAGGKIYKSKTKLATDTKRAVRIYLSDYGTESGRAMGATDLDGVLEEIEGRKCSVLEFGRFLSQRIFRNKIREEDS